MSYQPPPGPPPNQQNRSQPGAGTGGVGQPPQRVGTEQLLPQGQDRTEQLETLQSYEASKQQTEADRDQEILQKEYPKIDSSLIAAIYNDSGSLSATREMLQELSSSG